MNYKQKLYKKLRKIGIFIQAELSKDDAEALIDENKALRQKVNAYRSILLKENLMVNILFHLKNNLIGYLQIANFLI